MLSTMKWNYKEYTLSRLEASMTIFSNVIFIRNFFKHYFSSFNIGGICHFIHLLDVSLHAKEEKCL
jgi:hypothetical protein